MSYSASCRLLRFLPVRAAAILGISGFAWALCDGLLAGSLGHRTLIEDAFDDDGLGASPSGIATAGQEIISTISGAIFGQKVGDSTAVTVIRELENPDGNCLSIADNGGDSGFARVQFSPSFTTSGAKSEISFDLRRTVNLGDTNFVFSVIDNRTTPGTGRLCTLSLFNEKSLLANSLDTGFRIQTDVNYRVEISLDLVKGPLDTWSLKITDINDPAQFFQATGMRTLVDGSELSFFAMAVDATDGATAINLDNVVAITY